MLAQQTMSESEQRNMYLQNIEEYVFDEEKIVTYKWLSRMLNIHVNLSKELLYSFYSEESRRGTAWATYLLAGRLRESGDYLVTVVKEDQLNSTKKLFGTLTSEHIYSIQKNKTLPSWNTLYNADTQPTGNDVSEISRLASIHCVESVQRATEEMRKLRICPEPPPSIARKHTDVASSASVAKDKSSNGEESKTASAVKVNNKTKGGIAAMFAAQSSKKKSPSSVPSNGEKDQTKNKENGNHTSEEKVESKNKVSVAAMFSAKSSKSSAKHTASSSSKEPSVNEEDNKAASTVKAEVKSKGGIAAMLSAQNSKTSSSKPAASQSTKPEKPKKVKTKQKQKEPKKRKRIVVLESESSDDDIFDSNCDEDHSREPSPEANPPVLEAKAFESDDEDVIPPTPSRDSAGGRIRRRRKVIKDKTYKDEDGYIVTEKVTEYESFSESDSETKDHGKKPKEENGSSRVQTQKSTKSKVDEVKIVPKKVSPVKVKQQSLMSFFKKKGD